VSIVFRLQLLNNSMRIHDIIGKRIDELLGGIARLTSMRMAVQGLPRGNHQTRQKSGQTRTAQPISSVQSAPPITPIDNSNANVMAGAGFAAPVGGA
jgi:hypothetical protein